MPREIQAKPPQTTAGVDYSSATAEFAIGLSPIQQAPENRVQNLREYSADTEINFNRLLDTIQARLSGVTLPMIELELWNAIDGFCLRSTYFRHRVWWRMEPGVNTIQLDPFSDKMDVGWVIEQHGLYRYAVEPPATLIDLEIPTAHRRGHVLMVLKPRSLDAVKPGDGPNAA